MRRFISFIFVLTLTGCSLPLFQRTYADAHPEDVLTENIKDADFTLWQKFNSSMTTYVKSAEAPETIASAMVSECMPEIEDLAEIETKKFEHDAPGALDIGIRAIDFHQSRTEYLRQQVREQAIQIVVKHRLK